MSETKVIGEVKDGRVVFDIPGNMSFKPEDGVTLTHVQNGLEQQIKLPWSMFSDVRLPLVHLDI